MATPLVVIPTQTIGFYNSQVGIDNEYVYSCHTYPNDRLLQPFLDWVALLVLIVVIPTQTIGFYNAKAGKEKGRMLELSYLPKR